VTADGGVCVGGCFRAGIGYWPRVHIAEFFRLSTGGCDKCSPSGRILMAYRVPTRRFIINEEYCYI
jgi:hypothetical protein